MEQQHHHQQIPTTKPYILPNRKTFSDFITKLFLKYRSLDNNDNSDDNDNRLFPHQELVKEYLKEETPYQRLLLYHSLGTGKTRSSIAIAESLLTSRPIYIFVKALLHENYVNEIMEFGAPILQYSHHWEYFPIAKDNQSLRIQAKKQLQLSDEYLAKQNGVWMTNDSKQPNFSQLGTDYQQAIQEQIKNTLLHRYKIIHYNGLTKQNLQDLFDFDEEANVINKNPFHNATLIIDEVHSVVSYIINERQRGVVIYKAIMEAQNAKIVFLSGTPLTADPIGIPYLFNMLRGNIQVYSIPYELPDMSLRKPSDQILKSIMTIDTVENDPIHRKWNITRNPPFFISVYDMSLNRISVRYKPQENKSETSQEYIKELHFELIKRGWRFPNPEINNIQIHSTTLFPTDQDEFYKLFIDKANFQIQNKMMFMRRIIGLVSYFKGFGVEKLPSIVNIDSFLERIIISPEQYMQYVNARKIEIKRESFIRRFQAESDSSMFKQLSRPIMNYAIPQELLELEDKDFDTDSSEAKTKKERAFEIMKRIPENFFSDDALLKYSPKMLKLVENIRNSTGIQLVYSQYLETEGINILAEILKYNGYNECKIVKIGGVYTFDDSEITNPTKPFYAHYNGNILNHKIREINRLILNNELANPEVPKQIIQKFREFFPNITNNIYGDMIKILLITEAGAEGLNLRNVRDVHIMEPYWNNFRIQQIIGRAQRINSHIDLPENEQTISPHLYLTVFDPVLIRQNNNNAALLRRKDTIQKYYINREDIILSTTSTANNPTEIQAINDPATTDEYIYNQAYTNQIIIRQFEQLLKQSAIDCEIHKPLHNKNNEQMYCLHFDTSDKRIHYDDIVYDPTSIQKDIKDEDIQMNIVSETKKLQKVRVQNFVFLFDPHLREFYDLSIYELSRRLILIAKLQENNKIVFT